MKIFNAVIFDLDGLLIDSEPFWRLAEVQVFNQLGVPLTEKMCAETVGLRIDEVIQYWFDKFPWDSEHHSLKFVEEDILEKMEELISTQGMAMKGVKESISYFNDLRLPMAVASSSKMRLIECAVDRLNIRKHFQTLCSAEHCEKGKPHPEVYLNAAKALGIPPEECVALEDSVNGIRAAKAAGMLCVAIPEKKSYSKDFALADYTLENLAEVEKLQLW